MTPARFVLLACLVAAAASADDGSAAPPTRWSHARGPASGNGISLARAPDSFGRIAWTQKMKEGALAPPVVWDGAVFVLDGTAAKAELLALDAETGEVWARAPVQAPGLATPVAAARSALVVEGGRKLVQYRLVSRTLVRDWVYETDGDLSSPRCIDGEIYVTTPGALLSLRLGLSRPVWKVEGSFTGEPAVRDGHVYALRREGGALRLGAYARADGKEAASVAVLESAPAAPGGRVVVGGEVAAVLVPPEAERRWVLLGRKMEEGKPALVAAQTEKLLAEPLAGRQVLFAITEDPEAWSVLHPAGKQPRQVIVTRKDRPDLFEGAAACVWLGESDQCYGSWCGTLHGNVVHWSASERPEGAPLRKGLRFHAVPARHELLLFVPADGKSVIAIAPEKLG